MLTDDERYQAFNAGWGAPDAEGTAFASGLRAVEAAVRADQIEKDAAIADSIKSSHYPGTMGWASGERIAAAIRAQLDGEN